MIRSLHQRQLLFPVVLALVVVGVLALGAVQQGELAEATQQPAAEPAAVEVPRPAVSRADLQKTPLTYVSDYWAQLAEQSRPKLTLIGESPIAAVLIGPRLAVTTADAAVAIIEARRRDALTRAPEAEDAEVLPPPEEVGPFRLRGWDAGVGLALFDLTRGGGPAFTLTDPRGMLSGSYLGAVTLGPDGTATITPGYFVTTVPDEIDATPAGDLVVSMDLPSTLDIAAVVTLDGELVGVAYTTPGGHRVISSTALLSLIEELETETVCRSIEVADLDESVSTVLALQTGVLVEWVHEPAFDPEPSLWAGDVLLEWAGEPLESAAQFNELYDAQEAGALVRYRVLRSGRRVSGGTIMPEAGCEPPRPDPVRLIPYGLAVEWVSESERGAPGDSGWQVIAVASDGPSALAGVEEGDWLITVDRATVDTERDRPTLERVAEGSGPLLLSLRRDDRVKLVVISPAGEDE
ncbi:MAG: hypothetical protein V3T48_07105 [Vicinamibacterales bacterium]